MSRPTLPLKVPNFRPSLMRTRLPGWNLGPFHRGRLTVLEEVPMGGRYGGQGKGVVLRFDESESSRRLPWTTWELNEWAEDGVWPDQRPVDVFYTPVQPGYYWELIDSLVDCPTDISRLYTTVGQIQQALEPLTTMEEQGVQSLWDEYLTSQTGSQTGSQTESQTESQIRGLLASK